jgi:hypothetical protein
MNSCQRHTLTVLGALLLSAALPARADDLAWPALTSVNKPWLWWHWPGSAVDKADISKQLQTFEDAGVGGVQIIPIYGIRGGEAQYINFLSPEWMDMMGYTVTQAHSLDMGVDMALETGWCFGGPTITKAEANAFVVNSDYDVAGGGKLEQTFSPDVTQALMAFDTNGDSVDLKDKIADDGSVDWTAPPGQWKVYAISQRFSGQNVKRAAPGGRGPMLDPFYPTAMEDYVKWFDKAFDAYTGPKPRAVFQDSYEYQCTWSPDFFLQFEQLRGYKLQTVLPALFGDASVDETARVKSDYRETVSDLMAVKTDPIWMDWARQRGFIASYQAHGSPGNWLDMYADADIPETEMFHLDRNPLISKFASSAAHVAGHPLTGAETGTWLAEHFNETLGELKSLMDDMFISGVNHIFYHGCCYSPESAAWPGWLFYASTEMNPRNSIWHDVPTLNAYIGRCQSILQAGQPDDDTLLYWLISDLWNTPDGMLPTMTVSKTEWFKDQPIGQTAESLWNQGFAFDYISDRQLFTATATDKGIHVPGGDYKDVLVPPCDIMPVETLEKLIALANDGATVIFESRLPKDVPGWSNLAERRDKFKALLAQIKPEARGTGLSEATVGHGRILIGQKEDALRQARVEAEPMALSGVDYIRRATDDGWEYFIVNRHAKIIDGWMPLAHSASSIEILDPLTGQTGMAATHGTASNNTSVYLQLRPGGSLILRLFANKKVDGLAWNYWQDKGEPMQITGAWDVRFLQGGPEIPASFQTTRLASWTEQSDTNAQRFAGSALYTTDFDADAVTGQNYSLNLGAVCQSARVRLNGKDYGTLIASPFAVVVDNLKPRDNKLEVEVTNVSANRLRDLDRRHVQWKIFGDINIVDVNYHLLDASDWPLADSGLIGPVTLTPLIRVPDLTVN